MEIVKIRVKNYRALKDFSMDWQKDLSLIIGKNNCGKTSLLSIMQTFFSEGKGPGIRYDDFNLEFKLRLTDCIACKKREWDNTDIQGIELFLYIEYNENDNIANISPLLMDLDPDNHMVVLKIEYILNDIDQLKTDYDKYFEKLSSGKKNAKNKQQLFERFMRDKSKNYFKTVYKAVKYDYTIHECNPDIFTILDKNILHLSRIVSIKSIGAKRETDNKENDTSLSSLSNQYYERVKGEAGDPVLEEFEAQLLKTDHELTGLYSKVFEEIVRKVKRFGGTKENETIIQINSTLGRQELIKDNTIMTYKSGSQELPESYNGLGYLNLISIIIQIETIMAEFRCDSDKEKMSADINILFIEEPEAHTHPQLQYIFVKNIKELLREGKKCKDGSDIVVQTLITTHSSHIVAECDFDDIKYFCRVSPYAVISKNLCSLEAEYKDETDTNNKRYKFLKQYLTLNYAEVFFADKVILYEGDTERILLPAMMRKIDQEEEVSGMPLLSQNISIIAAGANAQLFSSLLAFLDIKTLIITDIDAVKGNQKIDKNGTKRIYYEACMVEEGEKTSNNALNYYFADALDGWKKRDLTFFKKRNKKQKILSYIQGKWRQNKDGNLMIAYQTKEEENGKEYYPRSFEDAFFCCNRQFIIDNISDFQCFQNIKHFSEKDENNIYKYSAYELAETCVKSKPAFPMEVLLNSESDGNSDYSNWEIPPYIKEGLLWLKQD